MKNGCLIHLAAKIRRNKLKWRVASAMLAGIALLFAFQGFTRADDDSNHDATAITACGTTISQPGRYFLAEDLKQCTDVGVSITVSDVKLDLRGHTIEGVFQVTTGSLISVISANGVGAELSRIDIEGPGTVTLGNVGIDFENVHHSRVHNLVVVGNNTDGITVNTNSPINASPGPTGNESHDNEFFANVVTINSNNGITVNGGTNDEFRDNVVTGNTNNGITVNGGTNDEFRDNVVTGNTAGIVVSGGNGNRFIHNNLSDNFGDGLQLLNSTNNVARRNTADANSVFGIEVGMPNSTDSVGNIIEDNIALGNFAGVLSINGPDLVDQTGNCTTNNWTHNSFNTSDPTCIQ